MVLTSNIYWVVNTNTLLNILVSGYSLTYNTTKTEAKIICSENTVKKAVPVKTFGIACAGQGGTCAIMYLYILSQYLH